MFALLDFLPFVLHVICRSLSLSLYLFYSILYFPTFLSVYDIHADVIDVNLNLNQLDENSGVVLDMHAENNFFYYLFLS